MREIRDRFPEASKQFQLPFSADRFYKLVYLAYILILVAQIFIVTAAGNAGLGGIAIMMLWLVLYVPLVLLSLIILFRLIQIRLKTRHKFRAFLAIIAFLLFSVLILNPFSNVRVLSFVPVIFNPAAYIHLNNELEKTSDMLRVSKVNNDCQLSAIKERLESEVQYIDKIELVTWADGTSEEILIKLKSGIVIGLDGLLDNTDNVVNDPLAATLDIKGEHLQIIFPAYNYTPENGFLESSKDPSQFIVPLICNNPVGLLYKSFSKADYLELKHKLGLDNAVASKGMVAETYVPLTESESKTISDKAKQDVQLEATELNIQRQQSLLPTEDSRKCQIKNLRDVLKDKEQTIKKMASANSTDGSEELFILLNSDVLINLYQIPSAAYKDHPAGELMIASINLPSGKLGLDFDESSFGTRANINNYKAADRDKFNSPKVCGVEAGMLNKGFSPQDFQAIKQSLTQAAGGDQ